MPTEDTTPRTAAMVASWMALWNGDHAPAPDVLATDLTVHAALAAGQPEPRGPEGLLQWIQQVRGLVPDLHFDVEVGPIVDGDTLVVRWRGTGSYAGGFPGAAAPPGSPVDFAGTDILRIEDGRFAEYWANSDIHVLFAQLGVGSA